MIIKCKICGMSLTGNIYLLLNEELLSQEYDSDYVPKGYYYINNIENEIEHLNGVSINKSDLLNFKYHKERLSGCCGPAGLDGLNILCLNGHEVATEKSDCWQPHEIIFEKELIVLVEEN
jgi:hypothetical protein